MDVHELQIVLNGHLLAALSLHDWAPAPPPPNKPVYPLE